jgi:hypothetical protein
VRQPTFYLRPSGEQFASKVAPPRLAELEPLGSRQPRLAELEPLGSPQLRLTALEHAADGV